MVRIVGWGVAVLASSLRSASLRVGEAREDMTSNQWRSGAAWKPRGFRLGRGMTCEKRTLHLSPLPLDVVD